MTTTTVIVIVISLLVLTIGYLILRGVFTKKTPETTVEGPVSLGSATSLGQVTDLQNTFFTTDGGTVQAFVYVLPYQRTGEATLCSSGSGGDPSCATDRYDICMCDKTDCSNCRHKGFVDLINISRALRLEVMTVPDASRPRSAFAQMVARGRKRDNVRTEETFPLPAIPFQKWTMVTIAVEGRRVDVFYNKELVLSKRMENMLDLSAIQGPLISGNAKMAGKIGKVRFFNRRLNVNDVESSYASLADTNGEPIFGTAFLDVFKNVELCPGGNCFQGLGIAVNPPSGLYEWRSSFA